VFGLKIHRDGFRIMIKKEGLFRIGSFKFENVIINRFLDTGESYSYYHETKKTNIVALNPKQARLSFTFHLELKPLGEIRFNGDCLLESTMLKNMVQLIVSKEGSEFRKRNQSNMDALNKMLKKRCLDYAKEMCDNDGFELYGFDTLINTLGLQNIRFNKDKVLELKGNTMIESKTTKLVPKPEVIDLEKCRFKNKILYPKPVVLHKLTVNGVFYNVIVFSTAFVYSNEKLPRNCLALPKLYKASLREYNPKKATAKLYVRKRM